MPTQLWFLRTLAATLVLVWQLRDGRFIVTADSREVIAGNVVSIYDSDACKLHIVSPRVVFFDTGYPRARAYGKVVFDGVDVAREVVKVKSPGPLTPAVVDSWASEWSQRMKSNLYSYLAQYPELPKPPGGSVGVFIVSLPEGGTYGSIADLDYSNGQVVGHEPQSIVQGFAGVGDYDGNRIAVRKFNEHHFHDAIPQDPVAALYQIQNETITELNSIGVGGLTDELVLSPGNPPLWIHRKPECPED